VIGYSSERATIAGDHACRFLAYIEGPSAQGQNKIFVDSRLKLWGLTLPFHSIIPYINYESRLSSLDILKLQMPIGQI